MKQFILKRMGYAALSLILLSLIIFLLVRLTGDPTVLLVEPGASKEDGGLKKISGSAGTSLPSSAAWSR